jgi:hypothetical protein
MSVDRYTKAVLTVIALCLVWIALGGPSPIKPVSAQNEGQRVIIAGWTDPTGKVYVPSPGAAASQRQAHIGPAMTEREADRTRAISMPFFAAFMTWNALTADAAPHQWLPAVGALLAAGATGREEQTTAHSHQRV